MIVDAVPLSEVMEIRAMRQSDDLRMKPSAPKNAQKTLKGITSILQSSENTEATNNEDGGNDTEISVYRDIAGSDQNSIFQINTVEEGFNLGRVYYFQAGSEQRSHAIISEMLGLAHAARKRADRSSRWEKLQGKVRSVQTALPFQLCMVALILMVSIDCQQRVA